MINANLPSTINHQLTSPSVTFIAVASVVVAAAVTGGRSFKRGQSPQFHLETANPRVD
jgi:hypothetical protein